MILVYNRNMQNAYINKYRSYSICDFEDIKKPFSSENLIISSESGSYYHNECFKNSIKEEGIEYSSPRIFKNTTTASITGYFCKKLNQNIKTSTMTSPVMALAQAYNNAISKKESSTVIFFEFNTVENTHEIIELQISNKQHDNRLIINTNLESINYGNISDLISNIPNKPYNIIIEDKLNNKVTVCVE